MSRTDPAQTERNIVVAWREAVRSLLLQERFYESTDHLPAGELITVYMILEALIPRNIVQSAFTRADLERLREKMLKQAFEAHASCLSRNLLNTVKIQQIHAGFIRLRNIAESLAGFVKLPGVSSIEELRSMLFQGSGKEGDMQNVQTRVPRVLTDRNTTQPFAYDPCYLATMQPGDAEQDRIPSETAYGRNMDHSTMRPASAFAHRPSVNQRAAGINKKPQR